MPKQRKDSSKPRQLRGGTAMKGDISTVLSAALSRPQSQIDREKQRLSFAYGNGLEEGTSVSKHSVKAAAKRQQSQRGLRTAKS